MRLTKRGRNMKKKLIIPFIFVLLISVILLVSCDKSPDDGQTGVQKPSGTQIFSDSFSIDNDKLYVKVSNDTEVFSFNDAVIVADDADFIVSTDIRASQIIESRTVNVEIGDNTFYVLVKNGNSRKLYMAVIRRKPLYTVKFDTMSSAKIDDQIVEEDAFSIEPFAVEKEGAVFVGWDYDFSKPITKDITVEAMWEYMTYNITYITDDYNSTIWDISDYNTTFQLNDENAVAFPTPKGEGVFCGWYLNDKNGKCVGNTSQVGKGKDITVYALFDRDAKGSFFMSSYEKGAVIGWIPDENGEVSFPKKWFGEEIVSIMPENIEEIKGTKTMRIPETVKTILEGLFQYTPEIETLIIDSKELNLDDTNAIRYIIVSFSPIKVVETIYIRSDANVYDIIKDIYTAVISDKDNYIKYQYIDKTN